VFERASGSGVNDVGVWCGVFLFCFFVSLSLFLIKVSGEGLLVYLNKQKKREQ